MDSPMKFNSLGVAFVSDDLPKRLRKKVDNKMEELEEKIEAFRQQAQAEFDLWLEEYGLEQAMGVIIEKDYTCGNKEKM